MRYILIQIEVTLWSIIQSFKLLELEPKSERRDVNIEETPRDKFNRIQNEFQELRQELEYIAKKVILNTVW